MAGLDSNVYLIKTRFPLNVQKHFSSLGYCSEEEELQHRPEGTPDAKLNSYQEHIRVQNVLLHLHVDERDIKLPE